MHSDGNGVDKVNVNHTLPTTCSTANGAVYPLDERLSLTQSVHSLYRKPINLFALRFRSSVPVSECLLWLELAHYSVITHHTDIHSLLP